MVGPVDDVMAIDGDSIAARMDAFDQMSTDALKNGSIEAVLSCVRDSDRLSNHTLGQFFNTIKASANRSRMEAHGLYLGKLNGWEFKLMCGIAFISSFIYTVSVVASAAPTAFFNAVNKVPESLGFRSWVDISQGAEKLGRVADKLEFAGKAGEMAQQIPSNMHQGVKSAKELEHSHLKQREDEIKEQLQQVRGKDQEKGRNAQEQDQQEHSARMRMAPGAT